MPNSSPGVPGHHALTCLGSGPQKVVTPQPAWGSASPRGPRRSSRLDLPRDPILGRLSHLDLPRGSTSRRLSCLSLTEDLHPDPGTSASQVATVLGRMSLYTNPLKFYPALVTLEILGTPNSGPGVPEGHHALTFLGIRSSKGCHASTCSRIC